jgi:hypothetical protein
MWWCVQCVSHRSVLVERSTLQVRARPRRVHRADVGAQCDDDTANLMRSIDRSYSTTLNKCVLTTACARAQCACCVRQLIPPLPPKTSILKMVSGGDDRHVCAHIRIFLLVAHVTRSVDAAVIESRRRQLDSYLSGLSQVHSCARGSVRVTNLSRRCLSSAAVSSFRCAVVCVRSAL